MSVETDDGLLGRASRSMFWNATLLPVITVANLSAAVVLRQSMGTESGVYDILLGILNATLAYTSLGIPVTLTQYVPPMARHGRGAVVALVRRAYTFRMTILLLATAGLAWFADPLSRLYRLGDSGRTLVYLVAAMLVMRALTDLGVRTLQSLLEHLRANLVQLVGAVLTATALIVPLALGLEFVWVMAALAASAGVVATVALVTTARRIRALPAAPSGPAPAAATTAWEYWRFALFMFVFDLSNTFAAPAFASPVLGIVAEGKAPVALFNVAFQIPMMVVVVILAGFQGLYRPMFSTILAGGDRQRLRTAFAEVTKVQAALLAPAGIGLALMLPVYVPLIFGREFAAAVPMAWILCCFLFLESLFNLGIIILSVDHRYGSVLGAQAIRIAAAPLFTILAARGDLLLATACFGVGRLAAVLVGHGIASRRYRLELPWGFVGRVLAAGTAMAVVVAAGRALLAPGWASALGLTVLGAGVFLVAVRALRVLGPREIDLLRRARLPGASLIVPLLAPAAGKDSDA